MRNIFKYPLALADLVHVDMPKGARSLSVAMQGQDIMVWALVDPKAPLTRHCFAIRGTGHPVSPEVEQGDFIGTVFLTYFTCKYGAPFVWHIFDLGDID